MDRNKKSKTEKQKLKTSLSARRAWIEISALLAIHTKSHVALRKESVDRNLSFPLVAGSLISRSPQGERG